MHIGLEVKQYLVNAKWGLDADDFPPPPAAATSTTSATRWWVNPGVGGKPMPHPYPTMHEVLGTLCS